MAVDLETVQAGIERWGGLNTEDAMALVAELRAAREVVTHARIHVSNWDRRAHESLAAYDKVTGEVP